MTKSENDHFNSNKIKRCKRCNADMKEKLACEIYELITASSLPFVFSKFQFRCRKGYSAHIASLLDSIYSRSVK